MTDSELNFRLSSCCRQLSALQHCVWSYKIISEPWKHHCREALTDKTATSVENTSS